MAVAEIDRRKAALWKLHADAAEKWATIPTALRDVASMPALSWLLGPGEAVVDRAVRVPGLRRVS